MDPFFDALCSCLEALRAVDPSIGIEDALQICFDQFIASTGDAQ